MYTMVVVVNNTPLYTLKVAKRVILKSHHKRDGYCER